MRRLVLAACVALGLIAQRAHAQLPAPVVSASTLTLPSKDSVGVVIAWTKRCATACPTAWNETVLLNGRAFRTMHTVAQRDTVRLRKPTCLDSLVVSVLVAAEPKSVTGVTVLPIRCIGRVDTLFEFAANGVMGHALTLAPGDSMRGVCYLLAQGTRSRPATACTWRFDAAVFRMARQNVRRDTVWLVAR